ncbi:hypothetical protein [Streptomyces hydrogenans]|uniref:hypothetical protein n=1 Tax=Streptomyces hydrogenans TaxID=1873719 RepID=UPI0037FF2D65
MRDLMPVRVPAGWAVVFNLFIEFPIDQPPTSEEYEAYLGEDILSLQRVGVNDGRWEVAGDVIDLGWYPGEDPSGVYRLCLVRDRWKDVPVTFEHRDCYVIQKALDTLLRMLSEGKRAEVISRVLTDPRFPGLAQRQRRN